MPMDSCYLKRFLSPAASVFKTVLITNTSLEPQNGLVHVDAEVSLVDQPHYQVICKPRVGVLNLKYYHKSHI